MSKQRSRLVARARWLAGGLVLSAGLALIPRVQSQPAAAGSPEARSVVSVPLEYREVEGEVITIGLLFNSQTAPFATEPTLTGRNLRRGTFRLGAVEGRPMGFIWDQPNGRLYLDLNGNGDLSDDSEGVLSCSDEFRSGNYQQFRDVRLEVPLNGVPQRMRFNMSLYAFGRLGGSLALRSYWSGKAVLGGREWELGMVPQLYGSSASEGEILLRPWAALGTDFSVGEGSLDTFPCGAGFFFQGQGYRLERKVPAEAGQGFEMVLTAKETAVGEANFTGKHIRRALLKGGSWTVVLEEPAGVVALPSDTYGFRQVHLRKGGRDARQQRVWSGPGAVSDPLVVQAGAAAVVSAGGPLTNTVTVERHANSLVLNYQLIGAGGEAYQPLVQPDHQAPRFAVYLGEKQIASGSFEFG